MEEGEGADGETRRRGEQRATSKESDGPISTSAFSRSRQSSLHLASTVCRSQNSHSRACKKYSTLEWKQWRMMRSAHKRKRIGICSLRMAFQPHPLNPTRVNVLSLPGSSHFYVQLHSHSSCTSCPRSPTATKPYQCGVFEAILATEVDAMRYTRDVSHANISSKRCFYAASQSKGGRLIHSEKRSVHRIGESAG